MVLREEEEVINNILLRLTIISRCSNKYRDKLEMIHHHHMVIQVQSMCQHIHQLEMWDQVQMLFQCHMQVHHHNKKWIEIMVDISITKIISIKML
jgi:hypothetical protein